MQASQDHRKRPTLYTGRFENETKWSLEYAPKSTREQRMSQPGTPKGKTKPSQQWLSVLS